MSRLTIGGKFIAIAMCGLAATAVWALPTGALLTPHVPFRLAKARKEGAADRLWLLGFDAPRLARPTASSVIRFRDGRARLSERGIARSTHAEFGGGSSQLTVDAIRIRRSDDARLNAGLRDTRSSSWSVSTGYQLHFGDDDTLRFAAALGSERRKTVIAIEGGHWVGSPSRSIGLRWQHRQGLSMDAGWFGSGTSQAMRAIDRNVALAAGAPLAEQGYRAEASIPVLPGIGAARIGIRLSAARLDRTDVLALAVPDARDLRGALIFGVHF